MTDVSVTLRPDNGRMKNCRSGSVVYILQSSIYGLYPIVYAEIMFCLYRLQKAVLMVFTPFHTWLQNYGTLFRIP